MVKAWVEMVISPAGFTAVLVHIDGKLFLRQVFLDVKFDQKHVTPEKRLHVSAHEFMVLKLRRCLKPDK
jgi:hypothetical protein